MKKYKTLKDAIEYMLSKDVELDIKVNKNVWFYDNTICVQLYPSKEIIEKYSCNICTVPVYSEPNEANLIEKIIEGTDLVVNFVSEFIVKR